MIKKYFAMATALLAMVGCSNDDILVEQSAGDFVSISSVNVDGQTRAVAADGKLVETNLYLFVDNADSRFAANGEVWTHTTANGWQYNPSPIHVFDNTRSYWNGSTFTWRAVAFHNDIHNIHPDMNPTYQILSPNTPIYDHSDLLWGMGTSNGKDLNITLNHALSRLKVNITYGTVAGSATVDYIQINDLYVLYKNAIKTANTLSEVAVPTGSKMGQIMHLESVAEDGYDMSAMAYVIPQTISNFRISFDLTNGKTLNYTAPSSVTFEAGKSYTLNVQVGQDLVVAGAITASPWESVDAGMLETE